METRPIGISLTLYFLAGVAVLSGIISYLSENTIYLAMIILISVVLLTGGFLATLLERIQWSMTTNDRRSNQE